MIASKTQLTGFNMDGSCRPDHSQIEVELLACRASRLESWQMSALGHKRKSRPCGGMSAFAR